MLSVRNVTFLFNEMGRFAVKIVLIQSQQCGISSKCYVIVK